MNNIRLLADILEMFHPGVLDTGFTQLKLTWRHDRSVATNPLGELIFFQNAKTNYTRNNHQAAVLGNFYGVYFWGVLIWNPVVATTRDIKLVNSVDAIMDFSDLEFTVAGKQYIPRQLSQPYWGDFAHKSYHEALATSTVIYPSMLTQKGSPIHIPTRPQETIEGRLYYETGIAAQDWVAHKITWYMLGIEAHRVEQG